MWSLLLTALCSIHIALSTDDVKCNFPAEWFGSVHVSVDIIKRGFHRELLYELHLEPTLHDVKALLIQQMPNGVYMDQYQLDSLREDTGLQVLLDSDVSLEDPAYVSSGFSALIYLSPADEHRSVLKAVVPVHGRYHRPSSAGGWKKITIEPPELLLRTENCELQLSRHPHDLVQAPCTIHNQSLCTWLKIQTSQFPGSVSLELPVGDFSLTTPVCAGTVLVTLLCFALLFRTIWKHGIF